MQNMQHADSPKPFWATASNPADRENSSGDFSNDTAHNVGTVLSLEKMGYL